jgi:hypothetical protein
VCEREMRERSSRRDVAGMSSSEKVEKQEEMTVG